MIHGLRERKSDYKNKRLIRSQYQFTKGYNKTLSRLQGFLPNDTWTTLLIEAYYAEVERKHLEWA